VFRLATLLLTAFLVLTPRAAFSAPLDSDYQFNQERSEVLFGSRHFGMPTLSGHYEVFSGSFSFNPTRIEETRVTLLIKPASVKTGNTKRDVYLKSEKFFWVEKHPEIRFVSKEIRNIQGNTFDIHGDLTIRGVTAPAVFKTELLTESPGTTDGRNLPFRTQTTIKRKVYALGSNALLAPFLFIAGEKVEIELNVVGIPVNLT